MPFPRFAVTATLLVLAAGMAVGQAPEDAPAIEPEEVPCVIDEQLSSWLALESIDRTIGALEAERRALAQELAATLQALDLLARADQPEGLPLSELTELTRAKSIGRDVFEDTYAEVQNRLITIDKTLTRRLKQQAALEARLDALLAAPTDG